MTDKKLDALLQSIADKHVIDFGTLEMQNSDSEDFKEVAKFEMKQALQAAFEAGVQSVSK